MPKKKKKISAHLGPDLFEGSLGEQMTFDPGQGLVRIIVRLLYQPQLLPLTLVQTRLHTKKTQRHKLQKQIIFWQVCCLCIE